MKSHMQIPAHQGKLNPFVEGEGSWEGSSTQRVQDFSLVESAKKGVFLLPVGPCYGNLRAPPSGLLTLFN